MVKPQPFFAPVVVLTFYAFPIQKQSIVSPPRSLGSFPQSFAHLLSNIFIFETPESTTLGIYQMANRTNYIHFQLQLMAGDDKQVDLDVNDLENGPYTEANRECRDMLCCLLFIAGLCAMGYLAVYGYTKGNTYVIYRGIDQDGNVCGDLSNAATAAFPYLYLTNIYIDVARRACVASCPVYTASTNSVSSISCGVSSQCNTNTYTATYDSSGNLISGATPTASTDVMGYDTTLVLDRLCVPNSNMFTSVASTISTSVSNALQQGALADFINDIKNNWQWLLAAAGVAFLISFIFMFLLRCLAGCIVWLSLFGIMFFFIGTGLIFLYNAGYFASASSAATYLGVPSVDSTYNEPIGWTLIGLGGFFFIMILCCCNRIRLAVAVCKSAGQFVASVCSVIFVPIFNSMLGLLLWGFALVTMVFLVSSATFYVASSSDYFTAIMSYSDPELIRFYVFVFLTLWINAFIGAMTIFVVASATCMWYYSHAPGNELSLPIYRSYKMIFRYHWGSLAFGALLVAIVQFLQMIVELFKRQAQQTGNKCMQYVLKCIQCCLACVECIVKFINTQAYIQIALRGKNFCYAAKDGFELVWSNPLRFAIVGGIGGIIMFLGKLIIAAATAFIFYLFVTYVTSIHNGYTEPLWQVALVFIIAYLISMLFMSIYGVAMDALLQCFIVDETNQKGKGKAKWAPADLADLMDTENE